MTPTLTTLAADIGDLLEIAIPVVVFLIVSLASVIKSLKESANKPTATGRGGDPSAAERARQVAEERRRRLQELARQRRGQAGGGTAAAPPPPVRLSRVPPATAEQERRRRLAERRAEAERRRLAHESAERRAAEHRQAVAERRRIEAAEAAQQLDRQRRMQSQLEQRMHSEAQRFESGEQDRMRVRTAQPGRDRTVHRHVTDAGTTGRKRRKTEHAEWVKRLANADRQSLQRAIILTEVFGKPVGLRQPGEPGPNTVYSAP